MKLYLDDLRPAPPGWTHVRWPSEAIELLRTGQVTEISLDYDLGDDSRGTGFDVILWVEKAVQERGFTPPRMRVHSSSLTARDKMEARIRAIEQRGR